MNNKLIKKKYLILTIKNSKLEWFLVLLSDMKLAAWVNNLQNDLEIQNFIILDEETMDKVAPIWIDEKIWNKKRKNIGNIENN